jgi:hypothetical protein
MNEYQDQHKKCPKRTIPLLPKRVIDVGGTEDSPLPRLYICDNGERHQYMALSYCWGGPQPVMTTMATLNAHIIELPTGSLPRTISDAIKLTRMLKIQFLWIDALCILQDSSEDKMKEINTMGDIYKNATVTIAAANARNVTEGFLSRREPVESCSIPFYVTQQTMGTVYLAAQVLSYWPNDPLFSRGWALQELLLSPRILVYDKIQMMWNCQTDFFKPMVSNPIIRYTPWARRLPGSVFGIKPHGNYNNRKHQLETWKLLMLEYNSRQLTMLEDRLPAIAGIARELEQAWGDKYTAGLWWSCMLEHLPWRRCPSTRQQKPVIDFTKQIGAPSWSWLSLPYKIDIFPNKIHDAEVVDCEIQPLSQEAPFGRVKEGILTLRANVLDVSELSDSDPGTSGPGFINFDSDFAQLDKTTRFVYLGRSSEKCDQALIVRKLKDQTYERIGMALYCNPERWASATKEIIVIK